MTEKEHTRKVLIRRNHDISPVIVNGQALAQVVHRLEQVEQLLLVQLQVADSDVVGAVLARADLLEQVLDGPWNDAALGVVLGGPGHRECLAGARLPVAQDRAIVAVQRLGGDVFDHLLNHKRALNNLLTI